MSSLPAEIIVDHLEQFTLAAEEEPDRASLGTHEDWAFFSVGDTIRT